MSEKRRRSLRTKGESPLEKRIKTEEAASVVNKKPTPSKTVLASTKSLPAKSTPSKPEKKKVTKIHAKSRGRRSVAVEVEDDPSESPAPKEATDVRPLPIFQQDSTLVVEDLQSIAESGVLASAMLRSRAKWTSDGIFPKYWSKPRTKAGKSIEPPGNPPKDSFSRLGRCRITVEPHILETVLYSIKEPKSVATANNQKPMISYTPPQPSRTVVSTPQSDVKPPSQPQTASKQTSISKAGPTQQLRDADDKVAKAAAPASVTQSSPPAHESQQSPTPARRPVTKATATLPSAAPTSSAPQPSRPSQASAQKPGSTATTAPPPSQDPVIQMLAQRASTDPSLKVLMKTVAAGEATKEELNLFQRHIDDLHRIIAEQRKAGLLPPAPGIRPPAPSGQYLNKTNGSGPSPNYHGGQTSTFSAGYRPPAPPKVKPPAPPTQRVMGIAIEFAGSPDRYLFPRHTMLEVFPGGTRARASFIVLRRGSVAPGGSFESSKEYNQPVTVFLDVEEPKVMHTIASSLAPAEEVRKHMDSAIEKSSRGPGVSLALRIPKASDDAAALVDETMTVTAEQRKSIREAARSQRAADEWASLCQYCFTYVPGGALRAGPGGSVCQTCQTLRQRTMASTAGSLTAYHKGPEQTREFHGPLALMLES